MDKNGQKVLWRVAGRPGLLAQALTGGASAPWRLFTMHQLALRATTLLGVLALSAATLAFGAHLPGHAAAAPKSRTLTATAPSMTTEPAAPTTAGSSPRAEQFGLAAGCCTAKGVSFADQVEGYAATGAAWARMGFNWRQTEATPGVFTWTRDDMVTAFRGTGMKVLGVLSATPAWATDPACEQSYGAKCAPTNPSDFAAYAAAVAERYDGDGIADAPGSPRVHAWEIWNEPNIAAFWRPAPDPAAYARLLTAAASAIRAVDPEATIVSAGLSPAGGTHAPVEFLRAMYTNGAGASFDALGFHPYSYPALPEKLAAWNAWQQMFNTSLLPATLRSLMVANGDGAKQIWATEYGAPTGGDTNNDGLSLCAVGDTLGLNEDRCLGESRQAAMVTEAYDLWQSYAWAGPLFWYSYQDLNTGTLSIENNFGLLRSDGTRKPAHAAYLAAAAAAVEDTTAPTAPTGLTASATASSISLRWVASSDDRSVAGYRVYRNGLLLASVSTTAHTDKGLNRKTRYTYTVTAIDAAGNVSAASAPLTVTTPAK